MLLFVMVAFAAEPECRQIDLVQDDMHAIERRGWVDGRFPVDQTIVVEGIGQISMVPTPHAPDVAETDRKMPMGTKEYVPLHLGAGPVSRGCVDFGDIRAFKRAYDEAGLPTPSVLVTVNGRILVDEYGASQFSTGVTDFEVHGLKRGDKIEVLIIAAGYMTPPTCHNVPTMDTEAACTNGFMLWERRAYDY